MGSQPEAKPGLVALDYDDYPTLVGGLTLSRLPQLQQWLEIDAGDFDDDERDAHAEAFRALFETKPKEKRSDAPLVDVWLRATGAEHAKAGQVLEDFYSERGWVAAAFRLKHYLAEHAHRERVDAEVQRLIAKNAGQWDAAAVKLALRPW